MAAGLFDENVDPKTGQKVPVYTMCTVPPNVFLGTVHDGAPMVLLPSQYDAWLEGGAAALGARPNASRCGAFPKAETEREFDLTRCTRLCGTRGPISW